MMKLLRYSMVILWSFFLIPSQLLLGLGMPVVAFKNVGACFKPKFEMYAPMFGSMALSSGFIENLRFYNVVAGVNEKTGGRSYKNDKALENDPIMKMILILFPSPAGQLTTEGGGEYNFGAKCAEEDIATLFNFVYAMRCYLDNLAISLPQVLDRIFSNKKFKAILEELKITESVLELRKRLSKVQVNILLLNIAKALEQERDVQKIKKKTFSNKLSKKKGKQEEGESESEQKKPVVKRSFYPKYMVEQVLGAFFCHKFAKQESLHKLLPTLHDDIIYREKIGQINQLLQKEDVEPALSKIEAGFPSLDDIWLALNRDYFTRILPYKNNQNPISNGNAHMYDRASHQLLEATFPDCVEVTIRHLMNFIFFNSETKEFDLSKLDAFMKGKDQTYIQNLKEFYKHQTADFANAGNVEIRSLWNKVVADLGKNVVYRQKMSADDPQNNNELDTGMLNLVRVFQKIFNLDLGAEPILEVGQEDAFKALVEERVSGYFQTLFEGLCPQEVACEINYLDVKIFKRNNAHDLSGNIAFVINDKSSEKKLFNFVIQVLGGENLNDHIDIQNLQINHQEVSQLNQNEYENIAKKLNELSQDQYSSSFFLADELREHHENELSPMYQIFTKTLNDTNGKLSALDRCDDIFEHIENVDMEYMKFIIASIMKDYLWDDQNSVSKMSEKILGSNNWKNEKFLNVFKENIKKLNFDQLDIKTFDVSTFPTLETLTFSQCKDLRSLEGSSKSLEEIKFNNTAIEVFDVSAFSTLKTLTFFQCNDIKSLKGLSESLKSFSIIDSNISFLDISQFSALTLLVINNYQQFKSLNRIPTSIERLILHRLTIDVLDLSKCKALKELKISLCKQLNNLQLFLKNLEELHLTDLELKYLEFSGIDRLKELDLSRCQYLKSLKLSFLKGFKKLNLSGLTIEHLELSGMDDLKSIILPSSLPKDQIKKIEEDYPGKVKVVGRDIE